MLSLKTLFAGMVLAPALALAQQQDPEATDPPPAAAPTLEQACSSDNMATEEGEIECMRQINGHTLEAVGDLAKFVNLPPLREEDLSKEDFVLLYSSFPRLCFEGLLYSINMSNPLHYGPTTGYEVPRYCTKLVDEVAQKHKIPVNLAKVQNLRTRIRDIRENFYHLDPLP